MKKVLVIAAHPDDEVLGLGGTLIKHVKEGDEVHLLIVTDGSSSQYRDKKEIQSIIIAKEKETKMCANILGITSIRYGKLQDMKLDNSPHIDINCVIEKAIREIQPDVVYTHFWGDVNLDHVAVFKSTLVATRPCVGQCVKELYCYYVPSSTEWGVYNVNTAFIPNVYVDISKYAEVKYKAINSYKTELRKYPHPRSIEYIEKLDEICGLNVGLDRAEAFVQIRKIK